MATAVKPRHTISYRICGLISLLFLGYVFFGYYSGLVVSFPSWPPAGHYAAAAAGACLVFYLLLHLARAMHRARSLKRGRMAAWLPWYFGLFGVSGMGFLLASMLLFEGPVVVRESIDTAVRQLNQLESAADTSLPVADFTDATVHLQQDKTTLHNEILNPLNCGVGDYAKRIIRDVSVYVPDFQLIRDSDKSYNCNDPQQLLKVQQIAAAYDQEIQQDVGSLAETKQFAVYHIHEREALKDQIHATLAADINTLEAEQSELAGLWNFFMRMELYYRSVASLEHAADDYSGSYQKLSGLVGPAPLNALTSPLAPALDVSYTENIASPLALLPNVATRLLRRWQVVMYVGIALMADLVVGYLWSAVILVLVQRPTDATGDGRIPGTDVRYLWIPAPDKR